MRIRRVIKKRDEKTEEHIKKQRGGFFGKKVFGKKFLVEKQW